MRGWLTVLSPLWACRTGENRIMSLAFGAWDFLTLKKKKVCSFIYLFIWLCTLCAQLILYHWSVPADKNPVVSLSKLSWALGVRPSSVTAPGPRGIVFSKSRKLLVAELAVNWDSTVGLFFPLFFCLLFMSTVRIKKLAHTHKNMDGQKSS